MESMVWQYLIIGAATAVSAAYLGHRWLIRRRRRACSACPLMRVTGGRPPEPPPSGDRRTG
jgi:hypothetical protein